MSYPTDGGAPSRCRRKPAITPLRPKPRLEEDSSGKCLRFGEFTWVDSGIVVNMNGHFRVRGGLAVCKGPGNRKEQASFEELSRSHRTSTLAHNRLPCHGRTLFCRRSAVGPT